jgi:hypothetical protein
VHRRHARHEIPAVAESTAYRLVAVVSERAPSTVSIDDHGETITFRIDVDGDLPDLTEVRDRATTISGRRSWPGLRTS